MSLTFDRNTRPFVDRSGPLGATLWSKF